MIDPEEVLDDPIQDRSDKEEEFPIQDVNQGNPQEESWSHLPLPSRSCKPKGSQLAAPLSEEGPSNDETAESNPRPKRFRNAFMLYSNDTWAEVIEEFQLQGQSIYHVQRIIGERYRNLPKEERAKYDEMAVREKQEYERLYAEWLAKEYPKKRKKERPKGAVRLISKAKASGANYWYGSSSDSSSEDVDNVEGAADRPTAQEDITSYNPEDQLKISAEDYVDSMLQKRLRVDSSEGVTSNRTEEREKVGSDGTANRLLPSHFHDTTKPNSQHRENFTTIQRALLKQKIEEEDEEEKRRNSQKRTYALRSQPDVKLYRPLRHDVDRPNPSFRHTLPFESIQAAVKQYNCTRIGYKENLKKYVILKHRRLTEKNPIRTIILRLKCSLKGKFYIRPGVAHEQVYDLALPSVIEVLTDRKCVPDKAHYLYTMFHFVYNWAIHENKERVKFSMQPCEKFILSAMSDVETLGLDYLDNFMDHAIERLALILYRKPLLMYRGVCSLLKVFTEMCRLRNLPEKPVMLAVDFLKRRNGHAAILIASMVAVWSEPFEGTPDTPDERKCLQSAISFGCSKWNFNPQTMHPQTGTNEEVYMDKNVKRALKCLDKYICPVPESEVILEVVDFLFAKIYQELDDGSPLDVEDLLFAPIIIIASVSEWIWVVKHIMNKHVIPGVSRYAEERNEAAFGVFCDLYAEIFSYSGGEWRDMLMHDYIKKEDITEDNMFIKDYAVLSMLRHFVRARRYITVKNWWLSEWLPVNTHNPRGKAFVRLLEKGFVMHRSMMRLIKDDFI